MKTALLSMAIFFCALSGALPEDFAAERHLCDAHLKPAVSLQSGVPSPSVSRYQSEFAALCDGADARSAAAASAAIAAKNAADLSALQNAVIAVPTPASSP